MATNVKSTNYALHQNQPKLVGVRARTEWRVGGAAGGGSIDGHLSSGLPHYLLSPPDQLTSRACLSGRITAKNCDQLPITNYPGAGKKLRPPPPHSLLSDLTNLNGREIEI